MALIEGFRVQNYRALRDVTLGRLSGNAEIQPLTPLTVVIGKNGSGKSTLFDAFGFIADCLNHDVEIACQLKGRGGFERLRSQGSTTPISFELCYREAEDFPALSYRLEIEIDDSGRPFIKDENLIQQNYGIGRESDIILSFIDRSFWQIADGPQLQLHTGAETSPFSRITTGPRSLGIAIAGMLKEVPRVNRFHDFVKGWHFSKFIPDAARILPSTGPQRHLNTNGDNVGNVVEFLQRQYPERFEAILERISRKIPGVNKIDTTVTQDNRVLLRFNDNAFQDPFFSSQMSDGTLKIFAYLLMLEDPEPPPFICIEEPENGLYHKLLEALAQEFRAHATGRKDGSQIFITTHQPYLVDALTPEEVWVLEKGADGFSSIHRAADDELVRNMVDQGLPLGGLWYSDYLDAR